MSEVLDRCAQVARLENRDYPPVFPRFENARIFAGVAT